MNKAIESNGSRWAQLGLGTIRDTHNIKHAGIRSRQQEGVSTRCPAITQVGVRGRVASQSTARTADHPSPYVEDGIRRAGLEEGAPDDPRDVSIGAQPLGRTHPGDIEALHRDPEPIPPV